MDDEERVARFRALPLGGLVSKRRLARAVAQPAAARVRSLTRMVRWWTFWSLAWGFAGLFFALAWVAGGGGTAGDIAFGIFLVGVCAAAAFAAWKLRLVSLALRRRAQAQAGTEV